MHNNFGASAGGAVPPLPRGSPQSFEPLPPRHYVVCLRRRLALPQDSLAPVLAAIGRDRAAIRRNAGPCGRLVT
jgi:hypothetical protein